MTGTPATGTVSEAERTGPRVEAGAWQPPPLELVVCEPLEDEAHRSAAQKSDAQLLDLYAIAAAAHTDAIGAGDGRTGEADYWDVLQRAIVVEAARRPSFGQELADDESGGRRQRRRRRKRLEALLVARAELAAPVDGVVVDDPTADRADVPE
jgi:hypothetical protein